MNLSLALPRRVMIALVLYIYDSYIHDQNRWPYAMVYEIYGRRCRMKEVADQGVCSLLYFGSYDAGSRRLHNRAGIPKDRPLVTPAVVVETVIRRILGAAHRKIFLGEDVAQLCIALDIEFAFGRARRDLGWHESHVLRRRSCDRYAVESATRAGSHFVSHAGRRGGPSKCPRSLVDTRLPEQKPPRKLVTQELPDCR